MKTHIFAVGNKVYARSNHAWGTEEMIVERFSLGSVTCRHPHLGSGCFVPEELTHSHRVSKQRLDAISALLALENIVRNLKKNLF